MSQEMFHGWWLQLRGRAKKSWAWLTRDSDLAASGDADIVAGVLQESYGAAKRSAVREVTRGIETLAAVAKRTARSLSR